MRTNAAGTAPLRQRADYTHSFNTGSGRHGWLRLTPAYSVKIVDEVLAGRIGPLHVLDPFCGTGTTALSAAYRGYAATTTDINPFLVWLARAKTAQYSSRVLDQTLQTAAESIRSMRSDGATPVAPPPISNIERWWPREVLDYLCALMGAIQTSTEDDSPHASLLRVAFCRTLIACSNAAFNHQSMSFKDGQDSLFPLDQPVLDRMFRQDVDLVVDGARQNPVGDATVLGVDARHLARLGTEFDLVVTSPPYANRMSYIRELRPYMYWLGYLESARDAGDLDWEAIGGTWGVATSRLLTTDRSQAAFRDEQLDRFMGGVVREENKNGALLANYVSKYFDDIWQHLGCLGAVLRPGAEVHYIVGNSTFYGVLLPVEKLYAEMLRRLGFVDVSYRAIRKRNSKKELFEFDVSAKWP